jgi:hypothetical protein
MATSGAAAVARWEKQLGSIAPGKRADLMVIAGASGSADSVYMKLISASERDVRLVVINGMKRYGSTKLMKGVDGPTDAVTVGGQKRVLNLQNPPGSQFPTVSYSDAKSKLTTALKKLKELAKAQEDPTAPHPLIAAFRGKAGRAAAAAATGGFALELDELVETPGPATAPLSGAAAAAMMAAKAKPLSETVTPRKLDPPTAVDDPDFLKLIAKEKNLPAPFITALKKLY